jgi:hypothetical protein
MMLLLAALVIVRCLRRDSAVRGLLLVAGKGSMLQPTIVKLESCVRVDRWLQS